MKLAILIQCHKSPKQVNMLIAALQHKDISFFVHVDRKSDIADKIIQRPNVIILPEDMRVDVRWAQFSQVEATLNLLRCATAEQDFDYYCLLSGQDFPIESPETILNFLEQGDKSNYVNLFKSFHSGESHTNNYDKRNQISYPNWMLSQGSAVRILRRLWVAITGGYNHTFRVFKKKQLQNVDFYFGSSWWCIHHEFAKYLLGYIDKDTNYSLFFKDSSCPDESFFQTLLMNSPYSSTQKDYLHYIDWSEGGSSPKNLTTLDYDKIVSSGKLFARKIDGDYELLEMLSKHQQNERK